MRLSQRVAGWGGRAGRGLFSKLLMLMVGVGALLSLEATAAWGDHPGALRSQGWSPLTAALVFGGLALLAGMLVIIIVTLLTRRDNRSS